MSDETIRSINQTYLWVAVALGVLVFAYGATPWDAIESLIESKGVDEEKASMIGFVAGYTLPLFLGLTIIGLVWITGAARGINPWVAFLGMAGILYVTGLVANAIGFAEVLVPDARNTTSVPPLARPLMAILQGYVNQYGWSLSVASFIVAAGVTLSLAKLMLAPADNSTPD
jgi:hypothetical protein